MTNHTKIANQPHRERMIKARERDLECLQLRLRGDTFDKIATQMGLPGGRGQAYRIFSRAMQRTNREAPRELRQLEDQRLDALWRIMWPKAQTGSCRSVDRCLAIMDRRAKLLGLNLPVTLVAKNPTMEQMIEAVENSQREHEAEDARIAARMAGAEADDDFLDDDQIDEWAVDVESVEVDDHVVVDEGQLVLAASGTLVAAEREAEDHSLLR